MEEQIKIFCLGGQDEKGKCLTVVEINDDIFVIDCGIKFPDKTKLGIDYILPRFDYLIENKDKVRAYIICRGYDTVLGGLPYIYSRVPAPIYCTNVTRVFIDAFCAHNRINNSSFDYHIQESSAEFKVAGRLIRFFPTCSNMANSNGVAISTDKGNIILMDNFIFENNSDPGYLCMSKMLSKIGEEQTLALMMNSVFAERAGYTSPKCRLAHLVEPHFKEAHGRIIMAISSFDVYNIEQIIRLAIKYNRKVIPYDDASREFFNIITSVYKTKLPSNFSLPIEEINRIPPENVMVIMTGFGNRLFHKIQLFANGENDDKILKFISGDTFIMGVHNNAENEVIFAETINEIYKTDCSNIVYFSSKQYVQIYPSQEDLKTMISIFKPKYFIPVFGYFRQLLAAAKMSVDMGVGLNHTSVFVIDNGMVVKIDEKGARLIPEKIITGDLLVDGKGIGGADNKIIEERSALAEDGVIILGALISLSDKKIVGGVDIQTRGLIFVKESEAFLKEINRVFVSTIENELKNGNTNTKAIEETVKDNLFKTIRRLILKTPIIVPIIVQIDK